MSEEIENISREIDITNKYKIWKEQNSMDGIRVDWTLQKKDKWTFRQAIKIIQTKAQREKRF